MPEMDRWIDREREPGEEARGGDLSDSVDTIIAVCTADYATATPPRPDEYALMTQ